jgi:hypothetical protein
MRVCCTGMWATAVLAALSACSGNAGPPASGSAPLGAASLNGPIGLAAAMRMRDGRFHGVPAPGSAQSGLYVSEFFGANTLGYSPNNRRNRKPTCTVPWTQSEVNDIAVDGKGALITPEGGGTIVVGAPSGMCAPELQSFTDSYGYASDAASRDAATSTIVVGNFRDNPSDSYPGSISLCTLASGCTSNLTNPNIAGVVGVALDKHGNCWASSESFGSLPVLVYFAKCSGSGTAATGFQNTSFGGLDFDRAGNLVAIDETANDVGQVWVYHGCDPGCTLVGGPFPMIGESVYGHLNAKGDRLAVADIAYGQVDIYAYRPTSVKYLYSFTDGLRASYEVQGTAYTAH